MATFRDGQEAQSGTIRGDPAGLRCRRDGPRTGQEAWHASTDGASGNRERDPARAQEARTEAAKDRSIEGCNRADAESRPPCAAETTPRGATTTEAGGAPP